MTCIQPDCQVFWSVVGGIHCFVAWEGTEVVRSEPRVSPLRRFSGQPDKLCLKVCSETGKRESPMCEERGSCGTQAPGPLWAAKGSSLRVLTDCHLE